jgi:CRP-like cAMP-binding protein
MQKCTAMANEDAIVLVLDKARTLTIIEAGLERNFERVLKFLQTMEIFRDQELQILLPLANNVVQKKFTFGEFIIKEGEVPRGLYMIVKGQCKVGSEKLNIRSLAALRNEKYAAPPKPMTLKGNFKDAYIRESQRDRERLPTSEVPLQVKLSAEEYNRLVGPPRRLVVHQRIYRDEDGKLITDHHVYKDFMVFFQLLEGDNFGGRVMFAN